MNNEIKEILDRFEKLNINILYPFEMEASDCKKLLDYITNLQEDYDRAMKLVDKGVENSYIKIKEQQKEIEKLTAKSTEWESKCYDLQEENERLKKIIKDNTILVKDENGKYQECNINPLDYKSRNEKAIKYIKEHQRKDEFLNLNEWQTRDLLKILQGEDNS